MDNNFNQLVDSYFRTTQNSNRLTTDEKILNCIQEFKMNISQNTKGIFVAWAFLSTGEVGYGSNSDVKVAVMRSVVKLLSSVKVVSSEIAQFSRTRN